jgi:hypothetical protein
MLPPQYPAHEGRRPETILKAPPLIDFQLSPFVSMRLKILVVWRFPCLGPFLDGTGHIPQYPTKV